MTLGLSTSGAIKLKTDGPGGGLRAVTCGCCGFPECQTFGGEYVIISESMYNSLRSGGNFIVNGALEEILYYTCSMNKSSSGIVPPGSCVFDFGVSEQACNDDYGQHPAYLWIGFSVCKVENEFRLAYIGFGECPSLTDICWSPANLEISQYLDDYDGPGYNNVGSVTINTSAGTLGPYGIWAYDLSPSFVSLASLDVTLTPF